MASFLALLGSWLIAAIKWIVRILLVVAFLALIFPLLPSDPFGPIIKSFASSIKPFASVIAWCLPVQYIVTSSLFWVACKVFFVVYKIVARSIGISVTDVVASEGVSGYLDD